ncbi:MAG: family 43 glycosylhydrolase [Candidatus Brocadiia bacterium]
MTPGSPQPPPERGAQYGDVDIHDPRMQIPDFVAPLFDHWMRDPHVTIGRDGYYLAGTTRPDGPLRGEAWVWNDGVRVWRSADLVAWEPLGLVWSVEEGPEWMRNFYVYGPGGNRKVPPEEFRRKPPPGDVRVKRAAWAPKIHYSPARDNYFIVGCMNFNVGVSGDGWVGDLFGGTFVLRSSSGQPAGPYEATTARPLTHYIDADLFEDHGTLYFLWQDGRIATLRQDLDGLVEVSRPWQTSFDPEPVREGVHMFKHDGLYHLVLTAWSWKTEDGRYTYRHPGHGGGERNGTYDALVATSQNIHGPYGPRYTALTDGGHGNFFRDLDGRWWGCVFFPPGGELAPARKYCQRPALVPMKWQNGRLRPDQSYTP